MVVIRELVELIKWVVLYGSSQESVFSGFIFDWKEVAALSNKEYTIIIPLLFVYVLRPVRDTYM